MSGKISRTLPRIRRNGACHQLFVDGKPLVLLAAEMQNSSASSVEYLERRGCWERLKGYHCNAALVPVSWELVEPGEGRFDFSLVDGIIRAARRHGLRLVLLWFGTWKNGMSSYAPAWVKTDQGRFPRCRLAGGKTSRAVSPFSEEARRADARAFGRLMGHVREFDSDRRTVVMVQVENEIGLLGAERDLSPEARRLFRQAAPPALLDHVRAHREELHPVLRRHLDRPGRGGSGPWGRVFGALAGEAFMAWHFARYVESVVAAGKAAYPLPMFVNAWLDYGSRPGAFPSGGPVAKMQDVWRAAAPSVDAFAPDIYFPDFTGICADFAGPRNPLIIPESVPKLAAQHAFWAVGECKAVCFSPFGVDHPHCWPDYVWESEGLAGTYTLLREMMPVVTAAQAGDRIRGVLQGKEEENRVRLGEYELTVRYRRKAGDGQPAAGMALMLGADEFVVAGSGFTVGFAPVAGRERNADFLWVEQGSYRKGKWVGERRLNGDDTWDSTLRLTEDPGVSVRRAKLYRYR